MKHFQERIGKFITVIKIKLQIVTQFNFKISMKTNIKN